MIDKLCSQLRQLRNTFPTLLQPLLQDHASPENLYNGFVENATCAAKKITGFVSFIGEDQSREVLDRAKESRAENKDGIKGWMVTQHADWLDHPSQKQEKGMDLIEYGVGENGVISTKTRSDKGSREVPRSSFQF